MVHNDTCMAVPTVSPVNCATPYKSKLKHELDAKKSYLRVKDKSSKSFAVNKRSALKQDLGLKRTKDLSRES